jgi:hypothetical protein
MVFIRLPGLRPLPTRPYWPFVLCGISVLTLGGAVFLLMDLVQGSTAKKTVADEQREFSRLRAENAKLKAVIARRVSMQSDNQPLKIELREQLKEADACAELKLENARLKRDVAQAKQLYAPPAGNDQKALPAPTERIFVDETPLSLMRFYDHHHTDIQSQALIQPYLTKG